MAKTDTPKPNEGASRVSEGKRRDTIRDAEERALDAKREDAVRAAIARVPLERLSLSEPTVEWRGRTIVVTFEPA